MRFWNFLAGAARLGWWSRNWTKGRPGPWGGSVKIDRYSSLRKIMRAARRGKLPEEWLGTIISARESAAERAELYLHRAARKRLDEARHA